MKKILCFGLLMVPVMVSQAQGWRGIVPLHSTRADVEALIGPPVQPNAITYDLKGERANVIYAEDGCEGDNVEWNVPPGTVIGITIYPQEKLMITDLRTDLKGFEKFINPHNPDFVSYSSKEEGKGIGTRADGEVVVVEYFPTAKDSYLRCPKFSTNVIRRDEMSYFKFDEYFHLSFDDEKARLENFAIRLQREPKLKAYIFIYAGGRIRSGEAKARAKRAKDYLVNVCGIEAKRIGTIQGDFRNRFKVELYAVPSHLSPATLAKPARQNP